MESGPQIFEDQRKKKPIAEGNEALERKIGQLTMEVDFLKFSPEMQTIFYNTRPGLTGIASIIFRDEQKYYSNTNVDPHEFGKKHIAPYKGELEVWYQKNLSLYTDLMLIFLTAWAIIAPESNLVYKIFKDLPERPEELR